MKPRPYEPRINHKFRPLSLLLGRKLRDEFNAESYRKRLANLAGPDGYADGRTLIHEMIAMVNRASHFETETRRLQEEWRLEMTSLPVPEFVSFGAWCLRRVRDSGVLEAIRNASLPT